jgi:hypothetical protein
VLCVGRSAIPRLTRCVFLIFWLCPASNVQADVSTTSVSSQILSLCGTCQVLIIGERHQQPESPVLFISLVTQLIAQGECVLVGLEVSAAQQDALDAVMAGTRTPEGITHPIIDSPSFQKLLMDLSKSLNLLQSVRGSLPLPLIQNGA